LPRGGSRTKGEIAGSIREGLRNSKKTIDEWKDYF
jgi:hypothetical protein